MNLNDYARDCHAANITWWHDPITGGYIDRNKGELLMLMVSEIAEAMEGERKALMDSHIPHRKSVEVELVDLLIRVFDYAGGYNLDLQGAYDEKCEYNRTRMDHKTYARVAIHGKKW